jgi:hypothetical protein
MTKKLSELEESSKSKDYRLARAEEKIKNKKGVIIELKDLHKKNETRLITFLAMSWIVFVGLILAYVLGL